MGKDLLNQEITGVEEDLLEMYERLKTLSGIDLDPCVKANVRAATVALWNAVNDLALKHEHLNDSEM